MCQNQGELEGNEELFHHQEWWNFLQQNFSSSFRSFQRYKQHQHYLDLKFPSQKYSISPRCSYKLILFTEWVFLCKWIWKKMQEVNRKYCLNPLQKLCSNKFRSAMNGSIFWIGTENLIIDAKIKLWLEFSSSHDSFFNEISPLNYYQKCFCQYLYNFVIQKVINIE